MTVNTAKNTDSPQQGKEPQRTRLYLRYRVERGYEERYGVPYAEATPERRDRTEYEFGVIERLGFCSYFLILASIMDFCREEAIPYAPGRGSVGGSYLAYLVGIHEVDPLEWDLMFERFMNPDRVSYPDVDIDLSQRDRQRVIDFVRETYSKEGTVVLQVGAFSRAGARSTIDNVCAAMRLTDDSADTTAYALRSCLPEKGNITGGTKQPKEIAWWLENGHGDRERFRETAEAAGWLDLLEKLDGMYTGLTRHAAGVVILSPEDVRRIPQCSPDGEDMVTGFDMYDLDEIGALKYDLLGLRTLDVICDAHKAIGGSGRIRDMIEEIWKPHKDDPEIYPMLSEGDTLGIFQMETDGYRRTLKEFKPKKFEDIVHLNALYRPGALDYVRPEDGKNMVEVFIERRHGREPARPPAPELEEILRETHGIFLYQEQAMKAVQILGGFTGAQADELRKGIGKKRREIIDALKPLYLKGCSEKGIADGVALRVWEEIEAAARYSWNKSHSVEYGMITFFTAYFKQHHAAAFYGALFNSYGDKEKERLSEALAEARQRITIDPPNINIAKNQFVTIASEERVIFGLNGVKGLGDVTRGYIEGIRGQGIPFGSFKDFCVRLVGDKPDGTYGDLVDIGQKKTLISCGAFDELEDRAWLLAGCDKPGKGEECPQCKGAGRMDVDTNKPAPNGVGHDGTGFPVADCNTCKGEGTIPKRWKVADWINHNRKLKTARPVPPIYELEFPTPTQLSTGEVESIGFYISTEPLADIAEALARVPKANHIGGEVEKIYMKTDKRGGIYPTMTLLTPALTKQSVMIFSSNWTRLEWLKQGMHVVLRGKLDGGRFLADAAFLPDDVRHFKKVKTRRGDEPWQTQAFDGKIETIRELEQAGYETRLL